MINIVSYLLHCEGKKSSKKKFESGYRSNQVVLFRKDIHVPNLKWSFMLKGNRIICIINSTHYFLWEYNFAAKSKCFSFGVLENLNIGFGDEKKYIYICISHRPS